MASGNQELGKKGQALEERLRQLGPMLVAYSGGVDSAFLAYAAHRVLGEGRMLAVIADSPSLARSALVEASRFAREQNIPLEIISTEELKREEYVRNDGRRCFHCKDELFRRMAEVGRARGFPTIVYGANLDDADDYRPGHQAARQHHVCAPFVEAGLSKREIRQLARAAGLVVWDKPASPCLSSRIEYGRAVTSEALRMVERGEDELRQLGFRQFRVRHHGEIVRIEIAREELARALNEEMAAQFTRIFKGLGFKFVTLDLEGYRCGSMNDLLGIDQLMSVRQARRSTSEGNQQ